MSSFPSSPSPWLSPSRSSTENPAISAKMRQLPSAGARSSGAQGSLVTKNRERLLNDDVMRRLLEKLMGASSVMPLHSNEHVSVDGTLLASRLPQKGGSAGAIGGRSEERTQTLVIVPPTERRPVGGALAPVAAVTSSHQGLPVKGDHVWEKRCSGLDLLGCDPGFGAPGRTLVKGEGRVGSRASPQVQSTSFFSWRWPAAVPVPVPCGPCLGHSCEPTRYLPWASVCAAPPAWAR